MPKIFNFIIAHDISAYCSGEIEAETPEQARDFIRRLYTSAPIDALELGGCTFNDINPYDTSDSFPCANTDRIVHIEDEDGNVYFEGEQITERDRYERVRDEGQNLLDALQRLLKAPDLNLENLETETIEAIKAARAVVEKVAA